MPYAPSMAASPAVRPFNPAPPPAVKHTEQHQRSTLASHLYPVGTSLFHLIFNIRSVDL